MQQAVLRWATGKDMVQYFHVQKSKKQKKSFNGAKNFKTEIRWVIGGHGWVISDGISGKLCSNFWPGHILLLLGYVQYVKLPNYLFQLNMIMILIDKKFHMWNFFSFMSAESISFGKS